MSATDELRVQMDTLPPPLAIGATADLYPWTDGWVLKLFHADRPPTLAAHEARVARAVADTLPADSGLHVPKVDETINVNKRHGLLYERIDGQSMLDLLRERDNADQMRACAHLLAQIHATLHTSAPLSPAQAATLPAQRDHLHRCLDVPSLPPTLRDTLYQQLSHRPDIPSALCHGDLHPGNLLLPPNRPPVIIDWCDATIGNPLVDVARTLLLLGTGDIQGDAAPALEARRTAFRQTYLEHYCQLRHLPQPAVEQYLPLAAAARLTENISTAEQKRLRHFLNIA